MKRQNPNRISELRLARRWNQFELAEAVGAHKMTISKLERGEMKLTQDWMERLAPALGVTASELLADSSLRRTVYISGQINDRGRREDQKFPEDPDETVEFVVDLGVTPPDTSVWYLVSPPFFGPIAQHGSLVRFTYLSDAQISDFIGNVCLIEISVDGDFIVGVVHRGAEDGIFDLSLPNGGRARNIRPHAFAPMSLLLPIPLFTPENFPEPDW